MSEKDVEFRFVPSSVLAISISIVHAHHRRPYTEEWLEDKLRSEAVLHAHRGIPERFALCAVGAKAVRALHPKNELIGTTINRVFFLISEREHQPKGSALRYCLAWLQESELQPDSSSTSGELSHCA